MEKLIVHLYKVFDLLSLTLPKFEDKDSGIIELTGSGYLEFWNDSDVKFPNWKFLYFRITNTDVNMRLNGDDNSTMRIKKKYPFIFSSRSFGSGDITKIEFDATGTELQLNIEYFMGYTGAI